MRGYRQVKVLQAAVKQSVEIIQTTTFWERFHSILFVPVNRRALSTLRSTFLPVRPDLNPER